MKAIEDALFALFSGDDGTLVDPNGTTALNSLVGEEIYREGSVPAEAAFPRIQYGPCPGVDIFTFVSRSYERVTFPVKAVDSGLSAEAAFAIRQRIDFLLTDRPLELEAGTCIYLRRIGTFEQPEYDGDQHYQHVGADYQALVA